MTTLVAILTYFVAFFLLPAWLWLFNERLSWRFKETERKERDWWLVGGGALLMLSAWLIWRSVLPDWWRAEMMELG